MSFWEGLGTLAAGVACVALAPVVAGPIAIATAATVVETTMVTTGGVLVAKGTSKMSE